MKLPSKFVALAVLLGVIISSIPAFAIAATSWYGANYSYDSNNKQAINVCDAETDNDGAYALYSLSYPNTTQYRLNDGNGSQPGCGYRLTQPYIIWRHRTCEDQEFQPDPCGAWAYP